MKTTSPAENPDPAAGADPASAWRKLDWERITVWGLALAGMLLRLWYLWDFSGSPLFDLAIGPDVGEYYRRAQEIAQGWFFPRLPDIHAPLYPCFLALMLKLGCGVPTVRIVQLILNFAAYLAFYVLLKRKRIPLKVRLSFLGIAMLLPTPVFYQAELISESLLVPLAAVFFWLRHYASVGTTSGRRGAAAFGAGVALGAMNLVHPLTLLFDVFEVGWELLTRNFRRAALMALALALSVGGFCIAQSIHYRRLCGIQANAGFNLYLGNNPDADGGCYLRPGIKWRKVHREAAAEAKKRGISTDAVFLSRAGNFWLRHPGRALMLWGRKALKTISPRELPSGSDLPPLLYFSDLMFYGLVLTPVFFILTACGLWRVVRERQFRYIHYLLLFLAMYLAQIVTVTSGRYRLLMLVPAALFAGVGAAGFKWRRYWFLLPLAAVVCGVFFVTDYGRMRAEAATVYAEAAFKKGDYRQAEALAAYALRDFVTPDPAYCWELRGRAAERFAAAATEKGRAAAREDRAEDAAEHFREARRQIDFAAKCYLKMTAAEPTYYKGWMLVAVFAEDSGARDPAGRDKWYEKAEKWYLKALECEPAASDLCYNYALFRFRAGRPCAEAVEALLRNSPNWSRAWHLAGIVAMRDRNFRRALDCFYRAAELAPDATTREVNLNNLRNAEYQLRNAE